jgi:hypothetical protein
MTRKLYHGRGEEGLLDIAETGVIQGHPIDDEDVFPEMDVERDVYDKDQAIWVTDSRECAKAYAWGGGYLEINPENVKVVEDRDSCYDVIMRDEIPLHHVDRIMVENREGPRDEPQRDLDIEIAELLDEEYQDIRIGSYEPNDLSIE